MNNPEYAKVGDKQYKINTDFRIAINCDKIARDKTIGDFEKTSAIIYKLYGEEALKNKEDWEKLLEITQKYLQAGQKPMETDDRDTNNKRDMDFNQDFSLIVASFMSDYRIDLTKEKMHWWDFYRLLNGLSNSELGDCCILNRIRNLRNVNPNEIKDTKARNELIKAQEYWKLDDDMNEKPLTEKEIASMERLDELFNLRKE